MKKYEANEFPGSKVLVYLASDVDALLADKAETLDAAVTGIAQRDARIAELERLLSASIELFQDECDPISEPDAYAWKRDALKALWL